MTAWHQDSVHHRHEQVLTLLCHFSWQRHWRCCIFNSQACHVWPWFGAFCLSFTDEAELTKVVGWQALPVKECVALAEPIKRKAKLNETKIAKTTTSTFVSRPRVIINVCVTLLLENLRLDSHLTLFSTGWEMNGWKSQVMLERWKLSGRTWGKSLRLFSACLDCEISRFQKQISPDWKTVHLTHL